MREGLAGRKRAMEETIGRLQLGRSAGELIQHYDLPAGKTGKSILRLELQLGFLRFLGKRAAREGKGLGLKERTMLECIEDAGRIQKALWKHRDGQIPLKEAFEVYKAGARITRILKKAAKGNKQIRESFGKTGRSIDAAVSGLKHEIESGAVGTVEPGSMKEFLQIAESGEDFVWHAMRELPEFTRFGIEEIEKIVEKTFEAKK